MYKVFFSSNQGKESQVKFRIKSLDIVPTLVYSQNHTHCVLRKKCFRDKLMIVIVSDVFLRSPYNLLYAAENPLNIIEGKFYHFMKNLRENQVTPMLIHKQQPMVFCTMA